ncbi:unnamed protein product [Cochlearia groenlandica]
MSTAAAEDEVRGGLPEKAAAVLVNTFRLSSVTQRLRFHIQAGPKSDTKEFQICCISLAKGIDFAIANNEIPKKLQDLPCLLKQIYRHRTDLYSKTAVMVLMISIKHACQLGWFPDSEGQELVALTDEMRTTFGSYGNTIPSITSTDSTFSMITERFYPFVKLRHVIVSLEIKPGYTMLAHDFRITKNMPHSLQDKIRLFVAQTDKIDTSACTINPQEVSFLLNGKMVDKRVNINMDPGPQLPTQVTTLLKYGTNLLQVMGNSKGHYIIAIAFTGVELPPENPVLKDYVQSIFTKSSPDPDVVEGASRVSLKCPISRSRIKLPVKGQLCKHLQCFDFWNYIHINMRKPSWRCPHCNQSICYPEIRLDQNMVKILKEVGHNAADVIFHSGGTWEVAKENDGTEEPVCDIVHDLEDPNSFLNNSGPVVLDLTGDDDDDELELFGGDPKAVERKPCFSDALAQCNHNNTSQDASGGGYSDLFNSDLLSLDDAMLDHLNSATGQGFSNLSQIPIPQDPTPVTFSQTPSLRDNRPATTIQIPSPQLSQVPASTVTPTGTYPGRTSTQRWNPTYPSQAASTQVLEFLWENDFISCLFIVFLTVCIFLQSRMVPAPVTSQPPGNVSSFARTPHIPRVLSSQFNNASAQRPRLSSPPVQSVTRTSDLVEVDSTTPDTSNWRPRMRGSLTPGSYSPALDHMIIRPTQQTQTRPQGSQQAQIPPVQPSQAQPQARPGMTRPAGPTAPWRT